MNELELLNKIKEQLISNREMVVSTNGMYILHIHQEDWHRIFKTDEYNELKEPPKNPNPPIQKRT